MTPVLLAAASTVLLAFLVLALVYPRLALLVLVTLDVSNINTVIRDVVGISPYPPEFALAAVALAVLAVRGRFRFAWSPVLLGLLVLFAGFCLSFLNAVDPVTSTTLLVAHSRDIAFFVVVYALVLSTDRIRTVLQAAVLVLAALAALTVFHEFVLGNAGNLGGLSNVPLTQEGGALTPRHAGTSSDVNFWARLLVLFTPLSLSLFAMSSRPRPRVLWAVATVALLLGIYLTQSRGGFLALFLGLLVWAVLAGGRYRKALLWLPLALLVLVPVSGIGSRLATLTTVWDDGAATPDPSLVTRERFQIDAWRMFLDAPATGHGIGSYGTLFPSYDRLANYYDPVTIVVASHNFFLEQAADGGVVLLLAWSIFLGSVLFTALRTVRIAQAAGDESGSYLAIGIVCGILGWLAASVFLHLSDFRALLLLAAAAGALDVQIRRSGAHAPEGAAPAAGRAVPGGPNTPVRSGSGLLLIGSVLVSALGVATLLTVLATGAERYSSTTTLAVVPSSSRVDPAESYQLDVVSRGLIVPTLAELLDRSISVTDLEERAGSAPARNDPSVTVRQSRLGGAVVVTVTAGGRQAADELGRAAVDLAQAEVQALDSGYQLAGAGPGPATVASSRWWPAVPPALVVLIASGATLLAARRRAVSAVGSGGTRRS